MQVCNTVRGLMSKETKEKETCTSKTTEVVCSQMVDKHLRIPDGEEFFV